jgi:zinc transport system substrate-binding protein
MCVVAAALFAAFATASPAEEPLVVVSLPPQIAFVRELAGELVNVRALIPPRADAHTYEPGIEQFILVAGSKAYFKIGHPLLPFEGRWEQRALRENPALVVVNTSEGVLGGDPHVWLSISRAPHIAENVARGLKKILPEQAAEIDRNLERFCRAVGELDAVLRPLFESKRGMKFFVFHPAWGYLAEEYGVEQYPLEQNGKEPDAAKVGEIISMMRAAGVPTIFVEPQMSTASAELIAKATGAAVDILDPMVEDWRLNIRTSAEKIAEALR